MPHPYLRKTTLFPLILILLLLGFPVVFHNLRTKGEKCEYMVVHVKSVVSKKHFDIAFFGGSTLIKFNSVVIHGHPVYIVNRSLLRLKQVLLQASWLKLR